MNIEWLREYAVFARYLNFSRAASMLNMTQPTLSSHIASLERELGFKLATRDGATVLTAAGKRFFIEAERLLADLDSAIETCRGLAASFQGTLTFLKSIRPGGYGREFDEVVRGFHKENPGIVTLELPQTGKTLPESLNEGNIDIGLVFNRELAGLGEHLGDRVAYQPLPYYHDEGHYLWVGAGSPLASKQVIGIEDLDGCRFLIPSNARYQVLEDWAQASSAAFGITLLCVHWPGNYTESIEQIGPEEVIIVTEREAQDRLVAGRKDRVLVRIDEAALNLDPCFAYLVDNENPALPMFLDFCDKLAS